MTALTIETMQTLLRRLMYKPGWVVEVYETEAQGVWIAISADVENSYEPGTTTHLRIKSQVPPLDTPSQFLRWLRWRLEVIEVHECHEWLRWKDSKKPVYDPHAEGADEPEKRKP